MVSILKRLNKNVYAVLQDGSIDMKYAFLQGFKDIRLLHEGLPPFNPRIALLLDTPSYSRLGDTGEWVRRCESIICIDHHISMGGFNGVDFIDEHASSTCELLGLLAPRLPIPLDANLAEILYSGIVFDTGQFRFSNTTERTHRVVATLLEAGADPEKISERIFFRWSLLRAKTMARILNEIALYHNDSIAISHLDHAYFRDNPNAWNELEGFSDLGISLDHVKFSAFLKEIHENHFKISLRATEDFDAGSVAARFGGGGHKKAAGCELTGSFEDVRSRLLTVIREVNFDSK